MWLGSVSQGECFVCTRDSEISRETGARQRHLSLTLRARKQTRQHAISQKRLPKRCSSPCSCPALISEIFVASLYWTSALNGPRAPVQFDSLMFWSLCLVLPLTSNRLVKAEIPWVIWWCTGPVRLKSRSTVYVTRVREKNAMSRYVEQRMRHKYGECQERRYWKNEEKGQRGFIPVENNCPLIWEFSATIPNLLTR